MDKIEETEQVKVPKLVDIEESLVEGSLVDEPLAYESSDVTFEEPIEGEVIEVTVHDKDEYERTQDMLARMKDELDKFECLLDKKREELSNVENKLAHGRDELSRVEQELLKVKDELTRRKTEVAKQHQQQHLETKENTIEEEEHDDLVPSFKVTPPRSFPRQSIGQWSVERLRNNMSVRSLVTSLEDKSASKMKKFSK